jgi:hypothetical protein
MTMKLDEAIRILKSGLVFEGGNTWSKTKQRIREALAVLEKTPVTDNLFFVLNGFCDGDETNGSAREPREDGTYWLTKSGGGPLNGPWSDGWYFSLSDPGVMDLGPYASKQAAIKARAAEIEFWKTNPDDAAVEAYARKHPFNRPLEVRT